MCIQRLTQGTNFQLIYPRASADLLKLSFCPALLLTLFSPPPISDSYRFTPTPIHLLYKNVFLQKKKKNQKNHAQWSTLIRRRQQEPCENFFLHKLFTFFSLFILYLTNTNRVCSKKINVWSPPTSFSSIYKPIHMIPAVHYTTIDHHPRPFTDAVTYDEYSCHTQVPSNNSGRLPGNKTRLVYGIGKKVFFPVFWHTIGKKCAIFTASESVSIGHGLMLGQELTRFKNSSYLIDENKSTKNVETYLISRLLRYLMNFAFSASRRK